MSILVVYTEEPVGILLAQCNVTIFSLISLPLISAYILAPPSPPGLLVELVAGVLGVSPGPTSKTPIV